MSLLIEPVLCRAGTMDNYAYIVTDEKTGVTAVVDASEAAPIVKRLNQLDLKPQYILVTHHHFDHVGGNMELKNLYQAKIVGPEAEKNQIPGLDQGLTDGETFRLGESEAKIISAPGHTLGHILWYFPQDKVLFTGDVLFNLCIGGIFEGTARQMWESLQKIKSLPDDVNFYPGHEYTSSCLDSAINSHPGNQLRKYAEHALSRLAEGKPVAPISLGMEKSANPYLLIERPEDFERFF